MWWNFFFLIGRKFLNHFKKVIRLHLIDCNQLKTPKTPLIVLIKLWKIQNVMIFIVLANMKDSQLSPFE